VLRWQRWSLGVVVVVLLVSRYVVVCYGWSQYLSSDGPNEYMFLVLKPKQGNSKWRRLIRGCTNNVLMCTSRVSWASHARAFTFIMMYDMHDHDIASSDT
jgi:hypothetical protein